jgi:TRAP-type C4-dicarboxylate transport system substrate-binding protein
MSRTTISTFVALATALILGVAPVARAAEPIQLDFGSWQPSTHHTAVNAFEPWKKIVEEKTSGRVKVNVYHGGVLGTSKAVLNDVKGGVYDVGIMVSSYYYDTPLFKLTIGNLPFAISSPTVGAKVMTEFLDIYAEDVFDKLNVKNMGIFLSDPYALISNKPIRRLEDVKGKKLRAAGKEWVQIAKDWGAVPVPMQLEEGYTSLERGMLDVMSATPGSAVAYKYYEPAPYVTVLGAPINTAAMLMNKTFYDKLPTDLKKLFDEELNPALVNLINKSYEDSVNEALEKMREIFKAKGKGEVITLSPEEKARFVKPTEPQWAAWVTEANKRGYPGDAMMTDFKALLKKNGLAPPF